MDFSIIICTHNRSAILRECIESIIKQRVPLGKCEVIIIDNNSSDNTFNVVQSYRSRFKNLQYFFEKEEGLSHARNRGYREAKGEWIVYIDDDAKLAPRYIERLNFIIENYDFDCFGGMYYAWHLTTPPKWLPQSFGTKKVLRKNIGPIDGNAGWLTGNNMAIKKLVLECLNGFDPSHGMKGNTIGYGEESELQLRLRKNGYKIGFDPELKIDHLVPHYKYKFSWHMKSQYAKGVSVQKRKKTTFFSAIFLFIKSLGGIILKRLPVSILKNIKNKNLSLKAILFSSGESLFYALGVLSGSVFRNLNIES